MNEPVELTREECVARLAAGAVGRVALSTPDGLRIVPVNYVVHDESVVIRTAAYTELGLHGPDSEAAFEIDHLDEDRRQGWSVVAVGRLERMSSERLEELRDNRPEPWAGGQRHLVLELAWRELSGRRLGSEWDPLDVTEPRMG